MYVHICVIIAPIALKSRIKNFWYLRSVVGLSVLLDEVIIASRLPFNGGLSVNGWLTIRFILYETTE